MLEHAGNGFAPVGSDRVRVPRQLVPSGKVGGRLLWFEVES
nr:hypothetical protein [Pasteuria penetrans]